MLILSYNVRGLRGTSKLTALQRLITLRKPKIIALQETMTEGDKAKEALSGFLKDWRMEAINAKGPSGGLLTS